jgi:predicted MFS family arabinose efflux permease
MPLHLFADRARWGSYAVMLMGGAAMFGVLFFLTQFLQGPLGYSPLRTGLAFLPLNLIIITSAQVSSRLVPRTGPRPLILFGTTLMVLGLLWLSRLGAGSGYVSLVLPAMATLGVGIGQIFVPVTLTAVSGVERRDSGVASAMLNVSQQVGGTLGLSALVTVSATATASQLARFASGGSALPAAARTQALVHGWATGFLLAAAFAALAWLAAVVVLRPRARPVPQTSIDEDVEVVPAEEVVLS